MTYKGQLIIDNHAFSELDLQPTQSCGTHHWICLNAIEDAIKYYIQCNFVMCNGRNSCLILVPKTVVLMSNGFVFLHSMGLGDFVIDQVSLSILAMREQNSHLQSSCSGVQVFIVSVFSSSFLNVHYVPVPHFIMFSQLYTSVQLPYLNTYGKECGG